MKTQRDYLRTALRWMLAIAFCFAGIVHLRSPGSFLPILPDWVPFPRETIVITGVCELVASAALLTRRLRKLAGVMLALYAVCVFPANIKHVFSHVAIDGVQLGWWYHAPRLAFQPIIVWWSLLSSGGTDWPRKAPQSPIKPEP